MIPEEVVGGLFFNDPGCVFGVITFSDGTPFFSLMDALNHVGSFLRFRAILVRN
jgi:hypothetical protein